MNVRTDYVVTTRREPPMHDSGSWSEHATMSEARDLAVRFQVEGGGDVRVYERRVTTHPNGVVRETWRRL